MKYYIYVTCVVALVSCMILLDASSCGVIIGIEAQCPPSSSPKTMAPNHTMVEAKPPLSSPLFQCIFLPPLYTHPQLPYGHPSRIDITE